MPAATHIPGVLESKLYAGVGAAQAVARPQLLPSEAMLGGRISAAVVSAPAGYGKSTLMSSWHHHLSTQGIQCAWLTLDADDDDPTRLMRHLIAALQRVDPSVGMSAFKELAADCADGARAALESLAGDLGRRSERMVLFIDDIQCLSSAPSLHIVDWLLNYSPPGCQYVIGARTVAHLRLGALRVRGRLLELSTEDLRFSPEEAVRFIHDRIARTIPLAVAERLVQKVEGWPAALELATLALRSGADSETVIEQFSGSDLNVVDYLGEVVLDRLDERARSFLLTISLFDRISAALATEVTGEWDAHDRLSEIHRANLFLTPLDRNAQWYRFHPIAADFLRQSYRRDVGDPTSAIRSGAVWLYSHGHLEAAINAVMQASDWGMAARWIADSVEALVYRCGYHHTILRWMKQLPEEWVDRYPTIRFHYAIALSLSPFQRESDAQLHHLERLCERMRGSLNPDHQLIDQIARDVELQNAMSAALRDDGEEASAIAGAWLERWPDAPLTRRGAAALVQGYCFMMVSETEQGHAWIATAKGWMDKVDNWYGLAWTQYTEALLHMKSGEYFTARRAAEEGQELLRRHLDGHPRHMAMLHAVLACVAYEFDEIDSAREHLERCMPRVGESGPSDAVIMGFLAAAKVERLLRGESAGLDKLHEGQDLGERRDLRRVTLSLAVEECLWHSRAGRFDDARRIATRFGLDDLDLEASGTGSVAEEACLATARYLLRTQPREVLSALAAPIADCQRKGLHRRWVELLLLRALAQQADGDLPAALDSLCEALAISAPRNYFRVIVDEADDLAPLFDQLDLARLRDLKSASLARRLREAMRPPLGASGEKCDELVVQLSKRELSILKRLESGLSNKELSEAIFISEGTLKWHLHNIYGKLGAKNRTGALIKARSLALI